MTHLKPFFAILAAMTCAVRSHAADPDISRFSNNNGQMSLTDVQRYFIEKKNPDFKMSGVSDAELSSPVFAKPVSETAHAFIKYHLDPNHVIFSTNEILSAIKLYEPQDLSLFGINIREKWQDVKANDPGNLSKGADSYSKAKPATFSYLHDFRTNTDTWSAHAAVFKQFSLNDTTSLVPSATIDRVSSPDPKKIVDSLVFRGAAIKTCSPESTNLIQDLRLGGLYATDTNFRSSQAGAEAEWEPTAIRFGIGAYHGLFSTNFPFLYRIRLFIHGEGGDVFAAGGNPNLHAGHGYFRLGPYAQLEILPTFFPRMTIYASWQDYEALTSDTVATRLFTAGTSLTLDAKEHFSIELKYKNGRQPLTAELQETFELALGIKF